MNTNDHHNIMYLHGLTCHETLKTIIWQIIFSHDSRLVNIEDKKLACALGKHMSKKDDTLVW